MEGCGGYGMAWRGIVWRGWLRCGVALCGEVEILWEGKRISLLKRTGIHILV